MHADTNPEAAAGDAGPRETGSVKWFNRTKGYGFILRDAGGEIFVHHRSIRGRGRQALDEGNRVSFRVTEHAKGPQADDVALEQ